MRVAIYPGSFNPWHKGHEEILNKSLLLFDKVIIGIGNNPEKNFNNPHNNNPIFRIPEHVRYNDQYVDVQTYDGLLPDFAKHVDAVAIIRGLRDGKDLDAEKTQQYWCEDLGLTIPIVYFICDRTLVHISSSAIRAVEKFK
jgi:pantetheine-phosphate adenylyltransferase